VSEDEANVAKDLVFLTTGLLLEVSQSGDRGYPWMICDPGEFELSSLVEVAEFMVENVE